MIELKPKTMVKVEEDHPYHSGRIGIFEFYGGPDEDVAVLSDPEHPTVLFAVGINDVLIINL